MTPQEKSLYHQIHPVKLATDRDYLALPVLATQTSGRADRRCWIGNRVSRLVKRTVEARVLSIN